MSEGNIKFKVEVDSATGVRKLKITKEALDEIGRAAERAGRRADASMKAATATTGAFSSAMRGASVSVRAATAAVNGAARAISFFHRAMGIFGLVSSVVGAAVGLWQAYARRTREAAEANAEVARKVAEARKKVEELNQARLDRAAKAMRSFADEIARARDNANALSDAVTGLASAQADFDASRIDMAVARGEMSPEEASAAKARIATDAAFDARKADTDRKLENLQAARTVAENYAAMQPGMVVGEDGRVDLTDSDAYRAYASAQRQAKIWSGTPREAETKHNEEIARQNWAAFIDTARGYENALAALEVATKEYQASLLKGDAAANRAAAAEIGNGVAAALEKSERERAKAQIDWEVQRGDKTSEAGALAKQRIDLEAELKAAKEAFEKRRKADEDAGRDTEADDVLATLSNNVIALQHKLDIVDDKARKEEESAGKDKGKEPEMIRASVDAWARLGATTGLGAAGAGGAVEVAKKHLMVANKHTDLMTRSAEKLAGIQKSIEKWEAMT